MTHIWQWFQDLCNDTIIEDLLNWQGGLKYWGKMTTGWLKSWKMMTNNDIVDLILKKEMTTGWIEILTEDDNWVA